MTNYKNIVIPRSGEAIKIENDKIAVPDNPVIPFIEGDGIGPDIWRATKMVLDAAIEKAFDGKKKISWMEIYAGEKAAKVYGRNIWLPDETLDALKEYIVAMKGPLTTPVGSGIKSLNIAIRQRLDLYASIRPVKYYAGVPAPVKRPQDLDVILFRENTEDIYTGVEFKADSDDAVKLIKHINKTYDKDIRPDSGIGIKHMSRFGTERLVRKAIDYAIENKCKSVTLVHKGNVMKFTEGAFNEWGYETAKRFYPKQTITEDELYGKYDGIIPIGKVVIKDRIVDNMFQQILLRPRDYEVLVTPSLNGDYLSDACAAQVGGLGIAPGANIGFLHAIFEATHGTAPKYAGLDKVNPGALILSGVMMLDYLGWNKASKMIEKAMEKTIKSKVVTYDFARQMKGAIEVKCSQFAKEIINNMK